MGLCTVNCSTGSRNTGQPSGVKPFGIPVAIVLVNLFDDAGIENSINCLTDIFDSTFLTTKLNETSDKRWYPVTKIKNALSVRAESNKQTFDDGDVEVVSEGIRNFTGLLPSKTRTYLGQLKNQSCEEIGFYVIDNCGNFLGSEKVSNTLKPIKLSSASWEAILVWATDATNQAITIAFNFAKSERDEDHSFIEAYEITADLTTMKGLIDVALENPVTIIANDTIEFDANTLYGGCGNKRNVENIELADWTVLVDGVPNVVISAPQVDGKYLLTLTTPFVLTNVITVDAVKSGYEVSTLAHTVIA